MKDDSTLKSSEFHTAVARIFEELEAVEYFAKSAADCTDECEEYKSQTRVAKAEISLVHYLMRKLDDADYLDATSN